MVVSQGDHNLLHFDGSVRLPLSGDATRVSTPVTTRRQRRRDRGARRGHRPWRRFLLFPGTSLWWLDHYDGFRAHLDARYPRLWRDRLRPLRRARRRAPVVG